MKLAPEAGGGNAAKITFFGIDAPDLVYCYNLVERRVVDRRGSLLVHFKSFNRADKGIADFKLAAKRGPLEYPAHRGEVREQTLGSEGEGEPRTLSFEGGDEQARGRRRCRGQRRREAPRGLRAHSPPRPPTPPTQRKRLTLHFFPEEAGALRRLRHRRSRQRK